MFTLKIINQLQDQTTLFTFENVVIYRPNSTLFQKRLEELQREDAHNPMLAKAHERYIAMIDSTTEELFYVDESDTVYITDHSGSLVETIISPKYL